MWLSMRNKYHISEIFDSIEGEGKRTGYMSIFVRFTGCNLRCSYCDTKYAQVMGQDDTEMDEDELIEKINSYPWKRVTLTGGEPLLQNIGNLVHRLNYTGYKVNIETNGAVPFLDERYTNVFYTMDWKCPSSGENDKMLKDNLKQLTKYDVLKFVVGNQEDLNEMRRIVTSYKTTNKPIFYVSPVFGEIEPKEIVEYVRENVLDVCVQLQLHKIIWDPDERGV